MFRNHSEHPTRGLFARITQHLVAFICIGSASLALTGYANAAVTIDQAPLAVPRNVTPNVLFVIDDSGSMDSEVLLPTNDGAAWWNTTNISFAGLDANDQEASGVLNFNQGGESSETWKKYVYLFPNGTGSGNRIYGDADDDHFAIPPTPPYAWARSSAYNAIYYDDTETYTPWVSTDDKFADADTSCTPSDPTQSSSCLNLFSLNNNATEGWLFTLEPGMVLTDGTDVTTQQQSAGSYFPATFYEKIDQNIVVNAYNCNTPDPAAYTWFAANYATISLPSNVDAIGPDGSCLKKYEIESGVTFPSGRTLDDEKQNFANWFAYYRKRHLTTRAGIVQAMEDFTGLRVGSFPINSPAAPTMRDLTTDKDGIFDSFYDIGTSGGGTPNRIAANYAGSQFAENHDIIQYYCQKNASILLTDGFSNPDIENVGNVDEDWGKPYADDYSDTLADIAAKYYSTRLREDLKAGGVSVPNACADDDRDPWLDCNPNLHMNFYGIVMGAKGHLFGQSYFDIRDAYTNPPTWDEPTEIRNPVQVDDLYHAAINGRGGLYDARTPAEIRAALKEALITIQERFGTSASLAANSTRLDTGTVTYQAKYFSGDWKGDLEAFSVDPQTKAISSTALWRAADAVPAANNREIRTYNLDGNNASQQYVAFDDPSNLSTDEQTALGEDATAQQQLIDYLRGDVTNERRNGGTYRNRETLLGDIVHSQPVYVGQPDPNLYVGKSFDGADKYNDFANTKTEAGRTPTVYVAANDGMLHGFRADTGAETYAYLPAAVITGGIEKLSDPDYGSTSVPHEFFNDGELSVADAYWSNAWHTVLVGTTGRGTAKAVYALDVTDPADVKLVWERSAGDGLTNSGYIGQITGKPLIVQTPTGWSALIGNGYNSAENAAALLQFSLTDGTLTVHTTDTNTDNGLAAPASLDATDGDGIQDIAYAGDLRGRVWKFDLTANDSAGTLLYTAKDSVDSVQPITAGMLVGMDPDTANVWLFFGTGRYLSSTDPTDTSTQTWYGIIVKSSDDALVTNLANGRSALEPREILAETSAVTNAVTNSLASRGFTKQTAGDMAGKSGWYMDLTSPVNGSEGERMVTPNQFQGNQLIGTSRIPDASDVCNPSGRGWIMALDPFTGTNVGEPFFDINGDGVVDIADVITDDNGESYPASGVGFDSPPNNPIFVGNTMLVSFENGTTASIETAGSTGTGGRISWRELVNP